MQTPMVESRSPVPPARTTSIRKLTKMLRPSRTRRTPAPALSIPGANGDRLTPPSSPSLYSLSSDGDSRSKLISETDRVDARPLFSPTSSTFSSSASEGHGDLMLGGLDNGRAVSTFPPESSPKLQRSPSADYAWATNKAYGVRPQRIIIADTDDEFITNDTPSLRAAGRWVERAKLQPLSPSEWIGSNVSAKKMFLGVAELSPVESENCSPLSSASSPATPRPRPVSEITKPGGDFDTTLHASRSHTITEIPESELLTESRQRPRPRSASEPRSFLGLGAVIDTPKHAGTVPSTPTAYIFTVPAIDSIPKPSSPKQTISPPPRQSSFPSTPMPEDVYFTAAGRRESRMYISPDAAPNYVPAVPLSPPARRVQHAHSNSEPVLLTESSPATRYATWNGAKSKREPTSGRPFEDATQETVPRDGDSTPVARKEELWSGNWNREDIQDVIRELRSLK
ncbi:hypothetical protein B0H19DRAFT_18879 [Mycena capillaripes]|nr:hypothetical protein B0H19DRAFT_18879 [Mycena capillaripes]